MICKHENITDLSGRLQLIRKFVPPIDKPLIVMLHSPGQPINVLLSNALRNMGLHQIKTLLFHWCQ